MTIQYGYGTSKDNEEEEDIITLNIGEKLKKERPAQMERMGEAFQADLRHALKIGINNGYLGVKGIAEELKAVLEEEELEFLKTLL